MEFQLSYFKTWKMMLWKCWTQYARKFEKVSSGHSTGKGQFSFQSQNKGNAKECSNYRTIALLSHASRVMLKFFKPGFNSIWIINFQMFKLDLEKAEKPEIKPDDLLDHRKSKRVPEKHVLLLYWLCQSLWLWITTNCGKCWKRWEYQTTRPASWKICMQVKKQQLELGKEQQTGSIKGKEYLKAVYCHPAYLTYMQSTSWEMLGWMKHKLESRLLGEISITTDMQMTPPLWQKVKKN